MYTESVFHHQSYEILKDLEPYMRDLTGNALITKIYMITSQKKKKKHCNQISITCFFHNSYSGLLHDVSYFLFSIL